MNKYCWLVLFNLLGLINAVSLYANNLQEQHINTIDNVSEFKIVINSQFKKTIKSLDSLSQLDEIVYTKYLSSYLNRKHDIVYIDNMYKKAAKLITKTEMPINELAKAFIQLIKEDIQIDFDRKWQEYYNANKVFFEPLNKAALNDFAGLFALDNHLNHCIIHNNGIMPLALKNDNNLAKRQFFNMSFSLYLFYLESNFVLFKNYEDYISTAILKNVNKYKPYFHISNVLYQYLDKIPLKDSMYLKDIAQFYLARFDRFEQDYGHKLVIESDMAFCTQVDFSTIFSFIFQDINIPFGTLHPRSYYSVLENSRMKFVKDMHDRLNIIHKAYDKHQEINVEKFIAVLYNDLNNSSRKINTVFVLDELVYNLKQYKIMTLHDFIAILSKNIDSVFLSKKSFKIRQIDFYPNNNRLVFITKAIEESLM